MMIGFWILIALFVAGLWWFGRASGCKRRCECEATVEGRERNAQSRRLTRGASQDSSVPRARG